MRAKACVELAVDARGRSVVRRLHSEAPLLVRVVDDPDAAAGLSLVLVGGAAGPLGGDKWEYSMRVGDGVRVKVRSVAAALAQPGPHGGHSDACYRITVGQDAALDWAPNPTVSVRGSDHRVRVDLDVAATARVVFAESLVLGRHGEDSGRIAVRQRVRIDGSPVLDHEVVHSVGALRSSGAQGRSRTFASTLVVADELPPWADVAPSMSPAAATFAVAHRCWLRTAAW